MEFVLAPVIPAKAGIQRVPAKLATGNQIQIAASGSLLPLREKARMRVRRAQARLARAGRPRSQGARTSAPILPVIPAKAGIHSVADVVGTPASAI